MNGRKRWANSRRPATAASTAARSRWATRACRRKHEPLSDAALLAARYAVDIAGVLVCGHPALAVTLRRHAGPRPPHAQPPVDAPAATRPHAGQAGGRHRAGAEPDARPVAARGARQGRRRPDAHRHRAARDARALHRAPPARDAREDGLRVPGRRTRPLVHRLAGVHRGLELPVQPRLRRAEPPVHAAPDGAVRRNRQPRDPRRHRGGVHRPGAMPRDDAHDRAARQPRAAACVGRGQGHLRRAAGRADRRDPEGEGPAAHHRRTRSRRPRRCGRRCG